MVTALIGVGLIGLVAVIVLLLNPPQHRPESADVVVVIAGANDGRHDLAVGLLEAGTADNLVVSHQGGPTKDPAGYALCRGEAVPERIDIWCMQPRPSTTTGEAQTFEELSQEQGWQTAVAVTNRPHHYRVRLNFEQCTSVEPTVASLESMNWRQAPYLVSRELGGYVKHFFTQPCRG
ncbi:hypothetical protein B841_09295 [Corynebacterium maris DSM 45190]|uniref:DUF218 domain-containing protein n=1 Tax=Corynebacterium maris DSM 45190 TaxID=1224163 RepID=S5SW70_9CORY|nr:hypothetical protein B841_09295 [Corynebacterium maris DSM 45190]